MVYRVFGIVALITVVFQIIFSFYYSSEIINQNDLLQQNQKQTDSLNLKNSELENKIASLSAISNLTQKVDLSSYVTITHHVQF